MSTSYVCNEGASKSNDDGVCEVNDMLQNMSTADKDDTSMSVCANCGKDGANNTCNKCKQVRYCNAVCKKVHKKKHKKDCEEYIRLAAEKHSEELRIAAEKHDEELFKQPPPKEDCPICFLRIPTLHTGYKYYSCCGKVICSGCNQAPVYDNQGNEVDRRKCPFCRTPFPNTEEEMVKRKQKRVEANDPIAIYNLGCDYQSGTCGYPQDDTKALELYHQAGELGYAAAFLNIGGTYMLDRDVDKDEKKAIQYWELAAMAGDAQARYNLGNMEKSRGDMDRSIIHHMIAVRNGYTKSLGVIKTLYSDGHATKEEYKTALGAYQTYLGEIKSTQRDKAVAINSDKYRYY